MTRESKSALSKSGYGNRGYRWVAVTLLATCTALAAALYGTSDTFEVWLLNRKSTVELEQTVNGEQHTPWPAFVLGKRYIKQGRGTDAANALSRARSLDTNSYAIRYALGSAYLMANSPELAIIELEEATHLDPEKAESYRLLGTAQRLTGNIADAKSSEQKAVELDPNDAEAWYQLGSVFFARNENEAMAAPYLKHAVELKPLNSAYQAAYGRALTDTMQFANAIAPLRKAVQLHSTDPSVYFLLGLCLHQSASAGTDSIEALTALQHAAALNPADYRPHYELGTLLEERREFISAQREFEAACRLSPSFSQAWFHLSRVAQRNGNSAKAAAATVQLNALLKDRAELVALVHHLEANPRDFTARIRAGALLEKQAKWEAAAAQYQDVLAKDPGNIPARIALINVVKRAGNTPGMPVADPHP